LSHLKRHRLEIHDQAAFATYYNRRLPIANPFDVQRVAYAGGKQEAPAFPGRH